MAAHKCPISGHWNPVNSKGQCKDCKPEPVKGPKSVSKPVSGTLKQIRCKPLPKQNSIRKRTKKKLAQIKLSEQYYETAIQANIKKNGFLKCDECGCEIPINENGNGSNAAHIISEGRNSAVYLDPINNFILCFPHVQQFDGADRDKMKVWPERERRRELVMNRHYNKKAPIG